MRSKSKPHCPSVEQLDPLPKAYDKNGKQLFIGDFVKDRKGNWYVVVNLDKDWAYAKCLMDINAQGFEDTISVAFSAEVMVKVSNNLSSMKSLTKEYSHYFKPKEVKGSKGSILKEGDKVKYGAVPCTIQTIHASGVLDLIADTFSESVIYRKVRPDNVTKQPPEIRYLANPEDFEGFVKYDSDKVRPDLMPADALEEIWEVLTYGANKYDDDNWAKTPSFRRYFSAALRHLWAWFGGEDNDPESGLHHLAHAATCLIFLLALCRRGKTDADDRPNKGEE